METANISGMTSHSIPAELKEILSNSFYIRTTLIRKNGTPRTIETTFVWDGGDKLILSGYPGNAIGLPAFQETQTLPSTRSSLNHGSTSPQQRE